MTALFRRQSPARATEEARVIRLGEREVPFVLRRSARRTFALQIDARGVRVLVPHPAREADIERFVVGHGRWLLDKLATRAARSTPPPFDPTDGACFPLFGERCRLRFDGARHHAAWRTGPDGLEELVLAPTPNPRGAIVHALRARALPQYQERVAEYCGRLGRDVPPVRLSSARTRWGSCSAASGIRLHWRLIHLRPALIDYVVAHEVAHLAEMNHSPRFWAVVEALYPDWKSARNELRAAGRTLLVIDGEAAGGLLNED